MSLMLYDPIRTIRALQNDINRVFERDMGESGNLMGDWSIRVDVKESKDQVVIKADLPGLEMKDIQIHVDNGRLTISGERDLEEHEKRDDYLRVERAYGRFSRVFQLPETTDVEHIAAAYKSGVLTITLPKKEQAKPRSIAISVTE